MRRIVQAVLGQYDMNDTGRRCVKVQRVTGSSFNVDYYFKLVDY